MEEGAGKDSGKKVRKVGERRNWRGTIGSEKRKKEYRCRNKGLLLCMDVKGESENVGVEKMEEGPEAQGVERYLRK
ncbi:hypothetical protein C7212DRAFT_325168 [Tuber magnatum]|uniref:Uncharacterized protein n=1 Tax=Tuber magnatum TaxID=42249 RepID=A0A317SNA4_9PEZI|nr:hypothetical protein C7212DRAFT_325168 [Tuber magnatum]